MQPDPLTGTRSPLPALATTVLALVVAKAAARLAGLGVLLAVVAGCVAAMTVGVALLRLLVLR